MSDSSVITQLNEHISMERFMNDENQPGPRFKFSCYPEPFVRSSRTITVENMDNLGLVSVTLRQLIYDLYCLPGMVTFMNIEGHTLSLHITDFESARSELIKLLERYFGLTTAQYDEQRTHVSV